MALEDDLAVLIYEQDVRYALHLILLHRLLICNDVIFYGSPALIANMLLHRHHRFICA